MKIKSFQITFGDILFWATMTMILSFPHSSRIKAMLIVVFFLYMLFLKLLAFGRVRNHLHLLWVLTFYILCYFSMRWAAYPFAVSEQLSNVMWAMMLSISVGTYVVYYQLDAVKIGQRFLPIALLFIVNVILNGALVDGRFSVGINENLFGRIVVGMTCYLFYWCKKARWRNVFVNVVCLIMLILAFLSGSRTSVLMLAIYVVGFLLFERAPKNPFRLIRNVIFAGIVLFVGYICVMHVDFLYSTIGVRIEALMFFFFEGEAVDGSTVTRMGMIETAKLLFSKSPWIGHGVNNFKYLTPYLTYAHNNYYELAVGLGIIGVVVYYSYIVVSLIRALRMWFSNKKDAIVPLAIMIGFLLGDIGGVSYFSLQTHLFLGIAIGMICNIQNKRRL